MRATRNLKLSLRMLARDWRAGELRLLATALVIAVGAVTAVGFFNERVQRGLNDRSAELLGADLILTSPDPIARAWIDAATDRGLGSAEATEFASVAIRGDRLQLTGVRAVGPGYPSRGALRVAEVLNGPEQTVANIPPPGTAWVESRVLYALALNVGDRIDIGAATFRITRALTFEPGRGGNFFAFAPRTLIHAADLPRTGVIQPGSRVTYGIGFAGSDAAVRAYREWLLPQLSPSQRLIDARAGNPTIGRAIDRVERYVGLTSLLAVLLAGVAIAMAARRYGERHYDTSAMLRCLGRSQRDIVELYLPQLALLGVVASAVGCALGFVAQEVIHFFLKDVFRVRLPAPGAVPVAFGILTGLIMLAGFALAPILRLKHVPPLRVLRRELTPLPPSAWLVYGLAAGAMLVLMWRHTGNWTLTLSVLAGTVTVAAILAALGWLLLHLSRHWHRHVGVAWRFGLNNLWRRARLSVGQILAFGLTLMAMAVIALARTDLVSTWESQLPSDTPNYFAVNVLPADVPKVQAFFATNAIRAQALYPMVRGRLTGINGVTVREAVTKEANSDEAIQRDLNLTWAATLPTDNRITQGQWLAASAQGTGVSVEAKLAQRLGIQLGDNLSFVISGTTLNAQVTSLRKVQWDSFHPNFFMIFTPGALDGFPTTYMTSFYLTSAQKPLLAPLVRAFPAITVIDLDQFLNQVRAVVRQATLAVEFVLLFVLAAGFAVLYAALAASLDERFYEGALLRTLGASRGQLRAGHIAEFTALGALAGILAAIGTELTAYFVYTRVFELEYSFKWAVWIVAPLAGGTLIGLAGLLGTRRVVERSPLVVLREV